MDEGRETSLIDEFIAAERDKARRMNQLILALTRGEELCEALGQLEIDGGEYAEWVKSGAFGEAAGVFSRRNAEAESPAVWNVLLSLAKGGNTTAIKLYFDVIGKSFGRSGSEGALSASGWADGGAREIRDLRSEIFGSMRDEDLRFNEGDDVGEE